MSLNKIQIRQPFHDQYDLTIEMESKMINSHLTSQTKLRHDFNVISCNEEEIECRLVLLDIFLEKSNNDLIKEVAQLTAAFNRMFNELHLKISQKGKVLDILNLDIILSKWNQTKEEMKIAVANNDELKKLIALNDSLFTNPEKLKSAVQANEFLSIFFGQYFDQPIPNSKKTILGKNLFSTANIDWKYEFSSSPTLHSKVAEVSIGTKAVPSSTFSFGFNNAAYSQFKESLDINKLSPQLSEIAEHKIFYPSGQVLEARIKKLEIAHEKELYMKLDYSLISGTSKKSLKEKTILQKNSQSVEKRKNLGIFLNENQENNSE